MAENRPWCRFELCNECGSTDCELYKKIVSLESKISKVGQICSEMRLGRPPESYNDSNGEPMDCEQMVSMFANMIHEAIGGDE